MGNQFQPSVGDTSINTGKVIIDINQPYIQLEIKIDENVTGDLEPGTVLGVVTASSNYAAYDDTNSDGTEEAKAILLNKAGANDVVTALFFGVVVENNLTGLDAAAKSDLDGKVWFI